MTPVAENPLDKAAEFIRGLPPDAAEAMLGRLSAEEAQTLRTAIARLEPQPEVDQATPPGAVSVDGSVELQLSGPSPAEAQQVAPEPTIREAPEAIDGAEWLRDLTDADPGEIAAYLSREQPRAIAAVLGYLRPELSAGVVHCLPTDEQAAVVSRLAVQQDADPDTLRVIASGLRDWLEVQRNEKTRWATRVATIRQIVVAAPEATRANLLQGLSQNEPKIAAALADLAPRKEPSRQASPPPRAEAPSQAPPAIAFEALDRFDGRTLANALGSLDPRCALLALAGASESLLQKLASGLPGSVARDLRQRIHSVGPTTLAEIDRSQATFAAAVARLVARRREERAKQKVGA